MKMPEPKAWAIFTPEGSARMWSTFQPHVQKLADAEGLTVTKLYDKQALIDLLEAAAVALRDIDALHNAGLVDVTVDAIRSMKEKL